MRPSPSFRFCGRPAKFQGVRAKHTSAPGVAVKNFNRAGMVSRRVLSQNPPATWEVPLTSQRMACIVVSLQLVTVCAASSAAAQTSLSLSDAISRASTRNPDVGSAAATEREAAERITQARSGYFPRVDVAESWQHGNQPVFVFSSRLAQRQFSAADLALDALNHPAPA